MGRGLKIGGSTLFVWGIRGFIHKVSPLFLEISTACFLTNRHCCLPKYGIRIPVLLIMDQLQVILAPPDQCYWGDATWRENQWIWDAISHSLDSTDELSLVNQHILYVIMMITWNNTTLDTQRLKYDETYWHDETWRNNYMFFSNKIKQRSQLSS